MVLSAAFLVWMAAGHHWFGRRTYRIGWEDDPPEQEIGSGGQPTGLAIEVVREAARRGGIALQWSYHSESSEAALRSGAVDLWPLMTITPERLKTFHISAPYLDSAASFLVRDDGHFHQVEELSGEKVGYLSMPINLALLLQYLPEARPVSQKNASELIASVCSQEIAAGFIEPDALIHELMSAGAGCRDLGLAMLSVPGARIRLGIGSTLEASAGADAIRDEIDGMFADGSLAALFAKWGYLSGRNVAYVESLLASRRRERWTQAAAAVLALLFLLALWQTLRYRRQSARARLAETSLRQSMTESYHMETRLRLLAHALKGANDCICITDVGNRILFVNDAFLRTYEYDESELIGQPVKILRSSRADRSVDIDTSAAIAGGNWRGELWNRGKTGREFPIALATSQVRDEEGKFVAMVGVSSDITARKQAEEEHQALEAQYLQAQKLESIGRLAGGVAHDFNNLLTAINGYSQLILAKMSPDDPLREKIVKIHNAGESAAALTRQLLAFSRKQVLQPRALDLNRVIEDLRPMLQRLLGESVQVRLALNAQSAIVNADPHQLEQVIMNLAVNGRDAMPGGGKLVIETAAAELDAQSHPGVSGERYVVLAVSDGGVGMNDETRRRIFEPFFTTKPVGQGTGLGLTTVQGIVAQSGGYIEVHSELGRGTMFKIYLPAAPGIAVDAARAGEVAAPGGTETVLIVEDLKEVLDYAVQALKTYGYRAIPAGNAEEALQTCERKSEPLDLLLVDVVMPNLNGPELVKQLEKLRPGMKVLFMSGYSDNFLVLNSAAGEPVHFIEKPFSPEELAGKVREVLGPPRIPGPGEEGRNLPLEPVNRLGEDV